MPSHKYSLITLLLSLMLAAFAQNLSQVQNLYTSPPAHPAWNVAFSPDGSLLAVALWDEANSIKILDADSGREVASLVGHTADVNSVAFSPDGSFLASGADDNTVKIWRTADFSLVHSLVGHTALIWSVAFSPAGDFLASGSNDKTVKIWRTADFSLVDSLEEHTRSVYSVAFSPAGDFLASGSLDKTVKIWRTTDFSLVDSLEEHTSFVSSVAFSPAGDFLASGSYKTVQIWRTADFSLVASLEEHTSDVRSVAFSPAGDFLAAGSDDNTVKIWHVNDSHSLHKTIAGANGSNYSIRSVAFHPAGTSLAIANKSKHNNVDGVVSLWGTPSRQAVFCPAGCGAGQYVDVTIYSTAGARVVLDGRVLAESSTGVFTGRFGVGSYRVNISKAGYQSRSEQVDVAANRSNDFSFPLLGNDPPPPPPPPPVPMAPRKALVIGNNDYVVKPLVNPVNDANAVTAALQNVGFEVLRYTNVNQRSMLQAMADFERSLQFGDIGLIYFAGHGVEIEGVNYLIPTDANPEDAIDLKRQAIALEAMLDTLKSRGVRFSIVILDACRNNPFEAALVRTMGRSSQGLAGVSREELSRDFRPQIVPPVPGATTEAQGIFIAFATEPGMVAQDGAGRHSPYTQTLLQYLHTPNMEIDRLFRSVRSDVYTVTGQEQLPWHNTNIIGEFYFTPQP